MGQLKIYISEMNIHHWKMHWWVSSTYRYKSFLVFVITLFVGQLVNLSVRWSVYWSIWKFSKSWKQVLGMLYVWSTILRLSCREILVHCSQDDCSTLLLYHNVPIIHNCLTKIWYIGWVIFRHTLWASSV